MKEQKQKCCICGKEFEGFGHNAEPVKIGRCCDKCNYTNVIPARFARTGKIERPVPGVKVGDTIHIVKMDGEPHYDGREGEVLTIDSIGQLHGTWGGCGVIPGVDEYYKVE